MPGSDGLVAVVFLAQRGSINFEIGIPKVLTQKQQIELSKVLAFSGAVSKYSGPALIAQTPSGDISRFSWARKFNPARILASQSKSRSCRICWFPWDIYRGGTTRYKRY